MYILVVIPLWTSYIVRIYSWKALLGREGVINNLLIYLRILKEPADFLLYSYFSVFIAFIGILLPFMILPIFTTLEKIPKNLLEAAEDLGSSKIFSFFRVIFPISLPGVLAGSFLVFVFSIGDYITPKLLGGPSGILVGLEIYSQFGLAFQWPLGSAMSFVLLIVVIIILNFINRGGALEKI
jgi:spermidine/putrescine transport system permease protein